MSLWATTLHTITAQTLKSGMVDLRCFHNVYMSCANLSSFRTLGPRGESNIIEQVPVTTEYAFTLFDNIVVTS